jgi:two-component system, OmpR family, sensor histidine kinase CiaH
MFRSLRVRLALSNALVLAVILVALGGLFWFGLERSLDRAATNELATAAAGQVTRIGEAGEPVRPADSDLPSSAAIQVGVFVAPDGEPLGEPEEVPTWLRRYPEQVTDLGVAGEHVRVVTVPALVAGRTVAWVAAGRSLAAEDQVLARARWLLLLGGATGLLASLWAGWWLAGRAVRPVERAYQAQAGFAADASHELRTPLTFVRAGVEVLAPADPRLGDEVLAEIDYLTGLSGRLLEIARTGPEGTQVPAEPFDVAEVIRSAARRSRRVCATHLDTEGPGPVLALGDRTGLEAALDAVLENVAVHGGGSASIRMGLRQGEAVVAVADRGPGLDPTAADRAFDRFFRADRSRARDTGGAGLGLALAKALIEQQGGSIGLSPTPGGGLTVTIALPAG